MGLKAYTTNRRQPCTSGRAVRDTVAAQPLDTHGSGRAAQERHPGLIDYQYASSNPWKLSSDSQLLTQALLHAVRLHSEASGQHCTLNCTDMATELQPREAG